MEVNFNPKQILNSNSVEPDEETLEQRREEIYLPNISAEELERFASLRSLFEEKMSILSSEDADCLMRRFVKYSDELIDRFDMETLRGVLLFYLISPEESDSTSGDDIERFDLDSESIESKVKEILEF
jgi:hypothetical protein